MDNANTTNEVLSAVSGVVTFLLVIAVWASWKTGMFAFPDQADASNQQHAQNNDAEDDIQENYPNEDDIGHIPYIPMPKLSNQEMIDVTQRLFEKLNRRRSVRSIAAKPVPPLQAIENIIKCAGTAPSGANLQPWTFAVLTSSDQDLRNNVRNLIEREEQINYERRMGETWVKDVSKLFQTIPWEKPYLTDAPYLIVILKHVYDVRPDGTKQTTYYNEISTAIATGMLLAAINEAGLVTVTTTPLNCGPSLCRLLERPANEKVLLLLPVGFAAHAATVPDLKRKPLSHIMNLY